MLRPLVLLCVAASSGAVRPPRAVVKFAMKNRFLSEPVRVERVAFEWLRRFYRQPRYPEPMKTSGRGRYKFSPEEGRSLLRIVRLMRQAAVLLTLTGVFTAIHAVHAAVTVKWTEFTSIFSVIDDVTISYYLLICASAFCAIAEAQAKSDTQFLLASLDATGRLWEAARIPLCLQMCYHASEALGPFVWAAISRAREIAAGTLADAVVKSVAARAGLD